MQLKIDVSFSFAMPGSDRYVQKGYRKQLSLKEFIKKASSVKGVTGISIGYPAHCKNSSTLKKMLQDHGLKIGLMEVALSYDPRYKFGTFTNQDSKIRQQVIDLAKRGVDAASELGAHNLSLWLGLDGYDYFFQSDYTFCWDCLVEGIHQVASHNRRVRIAIEPKYTEPRNRCFLNSAWRVLALIDQIGLDNVGVLLDTGHALVMRENPAEIAAILARKSRLFHIHLNDNMMDWDMDMIVGSANIIEHLELFYWMQRLKYDVWYGTDVFSAREQCAEALQATVESIQRLYSLAEKLQDTEIPRFQKENRSVAIYRLVRDAILK